jgi:plasmid stabilization system protein ParE
VIRYSDEALEDVARLTKSLAARDERLAYGFFEMLDGAEHRIAAHPETWPRVGRARKYLMEFGATRYVIHYVEDGADQVIQRIWHGREDRP